MTLLWLGVAAAEGGDVGLLLPVSAPEAAVWWASSGWKIRPDGPLPTAASTSMIVRAAANETEAAQLVVTPRQALRGLALAASALTGPNGGRIAAAQIEILKVASVAIAQPTDKLGKTGPWPDPLPPIRGPMDLPAGVHQPFWIRVHVPRDASAGRYTGVLTLAAPAFTAAVPFEVEVYGFRLPERMTCQTAFGFSPSTVFRYHGARTDAERRAVLEKYWDAFSRHHISPYDPAPLDPLRVLWPDVKPPPSKWARWDDARVVTNESAAGAGSLVIFDDRRDAQPSTAYRDLLPIPPGGLRVSFKYRTALPDQEAMITLNHHDAQGKWMSGRNNDILLHGSGRWDSFEQVLKDFPEGAASVQVRLWASRWTEAGERTGLAWFDDVSVRAAAGGPELIAGGDFEPPAIPDSGAPEEKLRVGFDSEAWDRATAEAVDRWHFNTFRLPVEGLGGGTFFEHSGGSLLGFPEGSREYGAMLASYLGGLDRHLRERGWLDEAFVYWFDEPDPHQYAFVRNGFLKLKRHAPGLRRMLTEQPEPGLYGGPDLWCPVSSAFHPERAAERRREGERFWWYICCAPKEPYATLFIDHPGTELRVWLWQTWQRKIEGILVWESVYWTSSTAYPDEQAPQNPWQDPMSWTSGYGVPVGTKQGWGNGDGRFLYPPPACADGRPAAPVMEPPVASIRWEMLRDGIEDYEYLAMLRRELERRTDLSVERRRELETLLEVPPEITRSMTSFTTDPAPIERRRDAVARALASLQPHP